MLNSEETLNTPLISKQTYQKLAAHDLVAKPETWLATTPNTRVNANALAGQTRALFALQQALLSSSNYSHAYMALPPGLIVEHLLQAITQKPNWQRQTQQQLQQDWIYAANPQDIYTPLVFAVPLGRANQVVALLKEYFTLRSQSEAKQNKQAEVLTQLLEFANSPELVAYLTLLEQTTTSQLLQFSLQEQASILVTHPIANQIQKGWFYSARANQNSLFGSIRQQTQAGTVRSSLNLIRAGDLLKANGGILILDAHELMLEPHLWRQLKYFLQQQEFDWQLLRVEGQTSDFYTPMPIPLQIKVVLVGSTTLFSQLNEVDEEFSNLFPYYADFASTYQPEKEGIEAYLGFLTYLQTQVKHRDFSKSGLNALLRYSSSLCEHQDELSLDAIRLIQFLEQVEQRAGESQSPQILAQHVQLVERQQRDRASRLAEMSWQNIIEDQIQIDTSGAVIGQINGLTVVSITGIEFGEPSRITASVHYGDGDIIDIERKSELSGNIHTKGVMILTAYLANLFAQKEPMLLSATLVFEQSYHEVDGDSASLAELCCLLSALAEVPIQQSLAVTGAIDQFGNVQAVGGINEKIEGYFYICQQRGLDGQHGVILPASNRVNLHLSPEIQNAVAEGKFHIYTVKHVTEAVELLTQVACGTAEDDENYLFGRIQKRLKELHEHQTEPEYCGLFGRLFGRC